MPWNCDSNLFLTFPNLFPTCPQLFSSNFHQHQDETTVEWKILDLCAMEGLREGITSPHTCYYQQDQDFWYYHDQIFYYRQEHDCLILSWSDFNLSNYNKDCTLEWFHLTCCYEDRDFYHHIWIRNLCYYLKTHHVCQVLIYLVLVFEEVQR